MNIQEIINSPFEAIKNLYEILKALFELYIEFCSLMPVPLNLIVGILLPTIITIILIKIGSWFV